MRIQVSGQRIDIGEALRTHVTQGIEEVTGKYAGRPTEATVVFSREGHLMCCEITVHLSTGLTAQASAGDPEIYAAFEGAREKMAKQLRRHKRRLKDHHAGRTSPVDAIPATQTVLAPLDDESEGAEENTTDDDGADGTAWAEGPAIIAETTTTVPSLSVGEAVMQMELRHASVLVFRNETRGAINVVYRRDDGTIGWIDPQDAPDGAPKGARPDDRRASAGARAASGG